jgi:hypothetical protein
LDLRKAFQNRKDCHWPAFKSGGAVLPAFQKRIVHWQLICPILNFIRMPPCHFSKALGATPRHLSSSRSKGIELAGFEKLSANSKDFVA